MSKFRPESIITMKDIVKEGSELIRKKTQEVKLPVSEEDKDALLCMLHSDYLKKICITSWRVYLLINLAFINVCLWHYLTIEKKDNGH